ncbi:MAG: NAD(P)-dependent oxidoreductase [Rudaea sp.]|nr:NAD(P)-dependent oxidoreductase [Rudaea sp.]
MRRGGGRLAQTLAVKLMSLSAQIIAIAPFSRHIAAALECPDGYEGVNDGASIITNIFIAEGDTALSRRLAEAFDVGPWELGKHQLIASNANLQLLRELFGAKNVEQFLLLASNGFSFYYLPNG